ncbi:hypothetical protein BC833DRAFT_567199 [Globomyces pollinis-pini]|nr:hypothetical protein BC833DRAFT_567199 [Globomyces pollinis-pini]
MPNGFDICYVLALAFNSFLLGTITNNGKVISNLLIILLLCNIYYCLINTFKALSFQFITPYSTLWFILQACLIGVDAISGFAFQSCYILRLQPFFREEFKRRLLWIWLILPVFYSVGAIVQLVKLFDASTDTNLSQTYTFLYGNALFAGLDFFLHCQLCWLTYSLLKKKVAYRKHIRKTLILFLPSITSICYFIITIYSMNDQSFGGGPIYLFWSFETAAFLIVNNIIQVYITFMDTVINYESDDIPV